MISATVNALLMTGWDMPKSVSCVKPGTSKIVLGVIKIQLNLLNQRKKDKNRIHGCSAVGLRYVCDILVERGIYFGHLDTLLKAVRHRIRTC